MVLAVETAVGIEGLKKYRDVLDRLNDESAMPSPFRTSAFLLAYSTNSEYFADGIVPYVYVVTDEAVPIGAVVMKRRIETLVPLVRLARLEFLATHDVDRPEIVAAPGREVEVIDALLDCLLAGKNWSMAELQAQLPSSVTHRLAHGRASARLGVRDIPVPSFSEVSVIWPDTATYFATLSKRMRSNVSRQARHLFAAGDVEFLFLEGGAAVGGIFDAYLELESRSWKDGGPASVRRHDNRTKFYRELANGNAGLHPTFIGIILDGVLVAGLINGHYTTGNHTNGRSGQRSWSMEMCFDESHSDLGAGQLLLLLTIDDAITRGSQSVNFLQHLPYFKQRWLADSIEVVNIQLIKRPGLFHARALVGDAIRKRPSPEALATDQHESETVVNEQKQADLLTKVTLKPAGELGSVKSGAQLLDAFCASDLHRIRRLDSVSAAAILPFSTKK